MYLILKVLSSVFDLKRSSNVMVQTDGLSMTSYIYVQTLVIACIVSEISAQIDHKSTN